jgi:hypothetical protein
VDVGFWRCSDKESLRMSFNIAVVFYRLWNVFLDYLEIGDLKGSLKLDGLVTYDLSIEVYFTKDVENSFKESH